MHKWSFNTVSKDSSAIGNDHNVTSLLDIPYEFINGIKTLTINKRTLRTMTHKGSYLTHNSSPSFDDAMANPTRIPYHTTQIQKINNNSTCKCMYVCMYVCVCVCLYVKLVIYTGVCVYVCVCY